MSKAKFSVSQWAKDREAKGEHRVKKCLTCKNALMVELCREFAECRAKGARSTWASFWRDVVIGHHKIEGIGYEAMGQHVRRCMGILS
jgi:hypothetical protein